LRILWSREADEDLYQIWDYLVGEASIAVADRQISRIIEATNRLSKWPHSGRPRGGIIPGMRSLVASPYVIFYRPGENAVEIVRVLHGRRDIEAVFTD
jgi:toxin ParE1/3/4